MRAMTTKPYPSQTQDRYIVRFPDGMRDRIAEAAKASGRSMNAEIVNRLEASFMLDAAIAPGHAVHEETAAAKRMIDAAAEAAAKAALDYLDIPAFLRRQGINSEPESSTAKAAGKKGR